MSYRDYLPSKTFTRNVAIIFFGTVLVIVFYYGAEFIKKSVSSKNAPPAQGNLFVSPSIKDISTLDHDNDGLPDWEEVLWGMDSNNPDTNGDGILDGAEVAPKRNQLFQQSNANSGGPYLTVSATEQFLRELLITATILGQAGEVSETGADGVVRPAVENIANVQVGKLYEVTDLHITQTLTVKSVSSYASVVAGVLKEAPIDTENAFAVAMGALQDKDPKPLKKLDVFRKKYESEVATLLAVPVPQTLVGIHLRLVNDFAFFAGSVQAMQDVFDNPIQAFAAVFQYQDRLASFQEHIDNYEKGIIRVLGGE